MIMKHSITTQTHKTLFTRHSGPSLLEMPLLNKGSAFSESEREHFNLMGLLPPRYESIEEQANRAYNQYASFWDPINKHVYLRSIQDNNETLFYYLLKRHIEEMMPIIYTPTVGLACERFSEIYRSSRGLFISYEQRHVIDKILHNAIKRNVKIIVVTDGERILGLGDQGIGGMGIPIGKLSLYTACAGISPAHTLPITLDVGTNNKSLVKDPMYMGLKSPRIVGEQYNNFIDLFMQAVYKRWPEVLVQFEDFGQQNAMPLLKKYKQVYRCFNDDIQGTAAVTLGTVLAACRKTHTQLRDHNIVFVGAGSAGCGIAELFIDQLVREGLTIAQAKQHVFMVGRYGLITTDTSYLRDFQRSLAHQHQAITSSSKDSDFPSLLDVVKATKASILIGVSGQRGLFTQSVISEMAKQCATPIIFPLSNPSNNAEAIPNDIIQWTEGRAIVATGSPFSSITLGQDTIKIAQCNNSYIFPGLGLGVLASRASRVTDAMLMVASDQLANASECVTVHPEELLPALEELPALSKSIAFYVAKKAMEEGIALPLADQQLRERIDSCFWEPEYRVYSRTSG